MSNGEMVATVTQCNLSKRNFQHFMGWIVVPYSCFLISPN